MTPLYMWVLHRKGEIRSDSEGRLFFDTREKALVYWQCNIPPSDNGWKPKKVRVTDAK